MFYFRYLFGKFNYFIWYKYLIFYRSVRVRYATCIQNIELFIYSNTYWFTSCSFVLYYCTWNCLNYVFICIVLLVMLNFIDNMFQMYSDLHFLSCRFSNLILSKSLLQSVRKLRQLVLKEQWFSNNTVNKYILRSFEIFCVYTKNYNHFSLKIP